MSYNQPPYGAPGGQYPPQQQYGAPPQQPYGQQPPYGQPPQQYGAPPGPPPGQYGAPSPQPPYGAPPQQYGAPPGPPPGHYGAPPPVPYSSQPPYGAPPPQQYGAPAGPPSGQYGAPSPQPPYGAPPQQYGAPPPQQYGQQAPYGQPQQSYPPDQPSLGYSSQPPHIQWDATADAKAVRKAMKGFGTDEKELIRVLCSKDPLQINILRDTYNRTERRDLLADLKSELGGDLEETLMGIARGPLLQDCHQLRESMKGMGTVEEGLTDVLMGRNNADIAAIKAAYQQAYKRTLEGDIKSDLSMKTEQHFMMVLAGNRAPQSAPVDHQKVEQDVTELYNATDGKMGTDEIKVCEILTHRNDEQIRAIAWTYQQRYTRSLETVISSEFSGHMKGALLHQLRTATDKVMRDAKLIEASMAGMGTKEKLLLNRVIRAHWDKNHMQQVQGAYQKEYKRSLRSRIEGETSGDFERALVACLVR